MARKEKREVCWRALRQLAFFAVCCLALLVVLPNSVSAATEDEVTVVASGGSLNAHWTLDSTGDLTITGDGMMYEYDRETLIPPWKEFAGQVKRIIIEPGITNIGKYAFYDCRNVTEVEIGASVESIGDRAFGSDYLTEVRIPASVKRMGEKVFAAARVEKGFWVDGDNGYFSSDERGVLFDKKKTILIKAPTKLAGAYTVPDTVETMKGVAFDYCEELTELTISDSVTNIEEYAVRNCTKLQTISIGDGMTDLGSLLRRGVGLTELKTVNLGAGLKSVYNAGDYFSYLPTLQEINVSNENPTYASSDGVLYSKDMTELIAFPIGRTGSFQIPEGVTRIAGSGFYRSSLTNIVIPDTVTEVMAGFRDCKNLEELIFPDTLKRASFSSCFSGCSALKRVHIPAMCSGIGDCMFQDCTSLTEITLPKELNKIGWAAFKGCSTLSKVTFQGNCPTTFESSAFSGVTAVCYYPDNDLTWTDEVKKNYSGTLTWIAYEVNEFEGAKHTYTLPDTDITLAYQVDEAQKTAMITLCNTDAKGALDIPESIDGYTVVAIGPSAFQKCIGLTSVVVPDTVTEIGEAAFRNCTALASATIPNAITSIKPYTFYNCALTDFKFPDGLVEIGDYAFQQLKMTSLTLPDRVSIVGEGAFKDSSLRDVTLPDSLTYIPDLMFDGVHKLGTVELPKMIVTIGRAAFSDCYELHSMVLPEGLISIGESAFAFCGASRTWKDYYSAYHFHSVTLPSTLQRIGKWAFYRCESLSDVVIPDKVTRIEERTFAYAGIGNITLSANLTSIGEDAFIQSGTHSITFRWSAPEIYRDSFDSITATCYYPSNNEAWTSDMFQNYGAKSLTWVGQEMDKPEGIGGGEGGNPGGNEGEDSGETGGSGDPIDVKVDNETSSGAGDSASITPPEKGWTSGTNTFSVSGSQPCLVAISRDGGATYERLPATQNEDGSYSFTAENMTTDTALSVLLLGDVNGDGKVSNADETKLNAAVLKRTELSAKQMLAANVNGDEGVTNADLTKLHAVTLGKTSLSW